MFSTITARYPGTCRRCGGSFNAGTRIRYGGRGRSYHFAAECPAKSGDAPRREDDYLDRMADGDPTVNAFAAELERESQSERY